MQQAGLFFDDEFCIRLLNLVKNVSGKMKRAISKQEFLDLYTQEYISTIERELSILKY